MSSQRPGGGVNVRTLLYVQPAPLINLPDGFGVLWSAKSASKAVMFWFLTRLGLLEQALVYPEPGGPKPHNFREDVLSQTADYRRWRKTCDPATLKWLRIIRNPYSRAVSSYRHALSFGYEDNKIKTCLGLSVADRGLSFQEFLDYLLMVDIANCNNHHRQQWHPIESHVTPYKVVNLDKEDLLIALDTFDTEIGLPPVSPETREGMLISWQRESRRHHKRTERVDDCYARVFTRAEAKEALPGYSGFLNAETRSKIERIYVKDFAVYAGYL
jgi:hypothetical protein